MSPIASLHSADREYGIDLPIWDVPLLLTIFGSAWKSNDLWETSHTVEPQPCSVIRRRMNLLGFTERDTEKDFDKFAEDWASDIARLHKSGQASTVLRRYASLGSAALLHPPRSKSLDLLTERLIGYLIDETDCYPHQEATVIRIALWAFGAEERVYVDISQDAMLTLLPGDVRWHNGDEYPQPASLAQSRRRMAWRNTKPILLLEGRYDAEVVQTAFDIRAPELAEYISIADFTQGTDGGTGGLRKTLRTLAQLEIPNTILGLFDNDAAGWEAVRLLDGDSLPASIGYATYPGLEWARSYPTIGPSGEVDLDINGLALSIEHFLGLDCLTDGRTLVPVEWTGLNRKIGKYQGSLLYKSAVQKRFAEKAKRARRGFSNDSDDWIALDQLIAFIVSKISTISNDR